MRRLLVLGAGTAGTMVVNKLRKRLAREEWDVTVVEASDVHYYQPGFLFLPFSDSSTASVVRPTRRYIPDGVTLIRGEVSLVRPEERVVDLTDGTRLPYDYLVIATGVSPRPDETPGTSDSSEWRRSIHEFYTYEGALALRRALRTMQSGRLVVHVTELPIKCPVAPLEFAFLTDDYLRKNRRRRDVDLTYVTPLPGAFTKPVASQQLGGMLADREISLETDFVVERVDPERKMLVSYDGREIPFDLLVTVPLNLGADFVGRSGLGDELNCVPVDRNTLLSVKYDTIFALGDASDVPASKAGSVAHFEVDMFVDNFLAHVDGRPMKRLFDGHANCFIESGDGKAMLIDFNYDTEPLPGTFPLRGIGPFRLLEESRVNHWGKLAFRWMYWNVLLPGRRLPLPAEMSTAGKRIPVPQSTVTKQED